MLLIIACIALLMAAIWYLGPMFGFGETRPLESVESRIILIVLATFCLLCFWLRLPLFIVTVAALCVLVWVIGPFILIGESYPLAGVTARLVVIGVILFVALLYGIWRLLLALRHNPTLLDLFIKKRDVKQETDVSEVSMVIRKAVNYVKKTRKNTSFFQRVFLARKSLDVLPWYMMIGTAGAGKTSAILASSQDFPMPEQLNQVGKECPATRNCECWFANDAVYIDTSGKYVNEPKESQDEWRGILKALKRYRPVKAINGTIVTLAAADIMGRSKAELFELSATLRGRLEELRQTLGVRFPVYVMITKLDQLPGFAEYFRILTEQEREQIWGTTFPYGDEMKAGAAELHEHIKNEFALLEHRIDRDMTVRHQEEYDVDDRKRMYSLPQDFNLLTAAVADVVQNIFFASRYDDTQSYTTLRGVYFCSSRQPIDFTVLNNGTVIQRWSNYVSNKAPETIVPASRRDSDVDYLVTDVAFGRQYFLKQLFSEIIVKDDDLARHNLTNESKYRFQRFIGHTLCILLAVFLLNGIYNSYHNNSDYLVEVEQKATHLEGEVDSFVKTTNDTLLPTLLSLTQYLPETRLVNVYDPDMSWRYGLYTGNDVIRASDGLYAYFLQRLLLPQMEHQVAKSLQEAVYQNSTDKVYSWLKLYLVITGQGKFDKDYLISSLTQLWEDNGNLRLYADRRDFVSHLNNLFSRQDWRRYGQEPDEQLIKHARTMLERRDMADRLYDRIKGLAEAEAPPDLTLNEMTKSQAGEIFTVAGSEQTIPGLYTYAGYHQVFKKKMSDVLAPLSSEDAWVMGKKEATGEIPDLLQTGVAKGGAGSLANPVQEKILTRYLSEYTRHWQNYLRNIRVKGNMLGAYSGDSGLTSDVYMLRTLVSADSPLTNLVRRAVKETTLSEKEKSVVADALKNSNVTHGLGMSGRSHMLDVAARLNQAFKELEKRVLWDSVDRHFAPLREFVVGDARASSGDLPPGSAANSPYSKLMGVLNDQYTLFVIYDDAIKNGNTPPVSESAQKLSAESRTWPDPLRDLIGPLLDGARKRASQKVIEKTNETIDESLGSICRRTLKGRYPFANVQQEVKVADFERFFAAGGVVDEYFKKNLADKVDTSTRPWRYKGSADAIGGARLDIFEHVEDIRSAFFQGDSGKRMELNFAVSVPYMDPSVTQLNMNVDGTKINYAHGPVMPTWLKWPGSRSGSMITINATLRSQSPGAGLVLTGPWALFRWLESAKKVVSTDSGNTVLVYALNQQNANIEVAGLTHNDELIVDLLRGFRCP
ncbi:type VI secretion system membrane subunit TssM [Enterobacillus tribolii]|uniref:type VI secretion system membrane subunit TssM n=1 Tax=Enterobacillus tribolii TaxID=1487935 RepID=UPI001E44FCC2|nr:type VI secretion system membrane subunit TssM [Enterobacillus tribolii]